VGVFVAIALGIGAMALIGVQVTGGFNSSALMQAGDDAAAGAGQAATGPARSSEDFFQRLGRMWNANERIEALERENRDLQAWRELAGRLAERNRRYEALLHMPDDAFGQAADIENTIAAQLVLDSGGPFTRTLVANAGSDHGVRVGYIAVNEHGLVGRVVSVGRRSCRVLMLDDYNSRIPVMGEASRVRAVLAGQATRRPELVTAPYQIQSPRLDFIVGAENLRESERVITSGDGGLFPRGIVVGVARQQGDGVWRVVLASSQHPIDFVRLVPFVGVERPEDAPAADQGPPLDAASSVSVITRDLTPPAPSPPPAPAPVPSQPRPRLAPTESPPVTSAPAPATPPPAPSPPPENDGPNE
jgi:rod shape-determining protein MreC